MQLWVIVAGLAFLMVLGSILWIMPSKRDRRIAGLRQAAIIKGVRVKLIKYPLINLSGRVEEGAVDAAGYSFDGVESNRLHSGWMLIRSHHNVEETSSSSSFAGWDWYINQGELPLAVMQHIESLLDAYKEQLHAVSILSGGITIGWNEDGTADDVIKFEDWANTLRGLLGDYFASLDEHEGE